MPAATAGPGTLWWEAWGDPADPAILMINGLGGQLVSWPPLLLHTLAIAGHHVITFDNRDAGLSTHLTGKVNLSAVRSALDTQAEPGVPYRLSDMANDGASLLDALDIAAAHVVGISMGGMVAQNIAIEHAERVRSLVSLMSSTGDPAVGRPNAAGERALFRAPPPDRDGAIAAAVEAAELLATPGTLDAAAVAAQAAWEYDRAFDPEGRGRQLAAIWASGDRTRALGSIRCPTLVIHGSADPLVSASGGRATAAAIPDSRYVEVPGMGHDLPELHWPLLLREMLRHFDGTRD
jgi:pimeloyl-ACP methyl ester carboxylesterase